MENEMNNNERSPRGAVVFLYTSSIIVFLFGIALIALNIYNYSGTVQSYVSQGYDRAMVTKLLFPQALLPGILEPVGVFFGIGALLLAAAFILRRLRHVLHSVCSCSEQAEPYPDSAENADEISDGTVCFPEVEGSVDPGISGDGEEIEILKEE
jgi:hypothetical protein